MKKIYLFLVHEVSNSLKASLDIISKHQENTVLIHVDKSKNIDDFHFLKRENIYFINNRVSVTWGGWSVVDATMNLLKESLKFDFEYCFLISGDDLPIMSNVQTNDFLSLHLGMDFIHYQDERDNLCDPRERVFYKFKKFHYRKKGTFSDKVKRRIFSVLKKKCFRNKRSISIISDLNINLFKGTQWFTLRKLTVASLLSYIEERPILIEAFRYSYCPDEVFFHSVLKKINNINLYKDMSKLNDALRYIDWFTGPDYPRELSVNDLNDIQGKKYFFARKISRSIPSSFFEKYVKIHGGNDA